MMVTGLEACRSLGGTVASVLHGGSGRGARGGCVKVGAVLGVAALFAARFLVFFFITGLSNAGGGRTGMTLALPSCGS